MWRHGSWGIGHCRREYYANLTRRGRALSYDLEALVSRELLVHFPERTPISLFVWKVHDVN